MHTCKSVLITDHLESDTTIQQIFKSARDPPPNDLMRWPSHYTSLSPCNHLWFSRCNILLNKIIPLLHYIREHLPHTTFIIQTREGGNIGCPVLILLHVYMTPSPLWWSRLRFSICFTTSYKIEWSWRHQRVSINAPLMMGLVFATGGHYGREWILGYRSC